MTEQKAQAIRDFIMAHKAEMLDDLLSLAHAESPTSDKAACDACAKVLEGLVQKNLGVSCRRFEQAENGPHLLAAVGEGRTRALIIGHYDTVWNVGALPFSQRGNELHGPGVYDMKYGDVSGLWALRALRELDMLPAGRVEFFFNSDEETGSHTSRPLFEQRAKEAECVLILEPASGPDKGFAIKSGRKGVGHFHIAVTGRASHAGNDYSKGRSAVLEAARLTEKLFALTDLDKGTTVNVGVLSGGTKVNVVAARADLDVDVRIRTPEEGERLTRAITGLRPTLDGISLEVTGGINRPPFVFTPQNQALFRRVEAIAAAMGHTLRHTEVGGGSDGNFISALGIPTLDGFGAVGDGAHAAHEHILLEESLESTVRLAAYLSEI